MSDQPTLEIASDTEAEVVRGSARLKLTGGNARYIIGVYRHCLAHKGTGATDAALFLWGVIAGMEHQGLIHAHNTLEALSRRRFDAL